MSFFDETKYGNLLNEETYDYLGKLYTHEVRNSYIYQYISSHLSNLGLKNFSEFFKYRSREEMKHSEMVRGFCDDLNIKIVMNGEINNFYESLTCVKDAFKLAYDTEVETNNLWETFYDMCYMNGNSRLFINLANQFLSEQIEEMKWANELMDYARNIGDNMSSWQRFDRGFDPELYGVGIGEDDD